MTDLEPYPDDQGGSSSEENEAAWEAAYQEAVRALETPQPPRARISTISAPSRDGSHDEPRLRVVDLAAVLAGDLEAAQPTILTGSTTPLIYPGKVHDLHGEPTAGKTWIALWAGLQMAQKDVPDGAFVFVDWEDSEFTFVSRLLALGASPEVISDPSRIVYVRPEGPLGLLENDALLDLALRSGAALVVFDAMAPALALDGAEENSNSDVASWLGRVARPFTHAGIAVLILDHVTKDPQNRTRGARGAGAKLGFLDGASYEATVVRPFSRNTPGEVKLKIAKDRNGFVGPMGHIAAHVHFTPDGDGNLALSVTPPPSTTDEAGHFIPTRLMEKVSRHFESREPGTQMTGRQIQDAVVGKAAAKRTAIERLVEEGFLRAETGGPRGATLYDLVQAYREPTPEEVDPTHIDVVTPSPSVPSDPARPSASQRVPGRAESSASQRVPPFVRDALRDALSDQEDAVDEVQRVPTQEPLILDPEDPDPDWV